MVADVRSMRDEILNKNHRRLDTERCRASYRSSEKGGLPATAGRKVKQVYRLHVRSKRSSYAQDDLHSTPSTFNRT